MLCPWLFAACPRNVAVIFRTSSKPQLEEHEQGSEDAEIQQTVHCSSSSSLIVLVIFRCQNLGSMGVTDLPRVPVL